MMILQRNIAVAAIVLLSAGDIHAEVKRLTVGGVAPGAPGSWRSSGSMERIDDSSEPAAILPMRIDRTQNILNLLYKEGRLFAATGVAGDVASDKRLQYLARPGNGRIWSPNLDFALRESILGIANGLQDDQAFEYFNRTAGNKGVSIYVDMGASFPVSQIMFYPRKSGLNQELYMKGYELWASDGSKANTTAEGQPVYHLLHSVPVNTTRVANDTSFTPQHIRFIKIKCTADQPFEIDQLEVRGDGFVAEASYLSNVMDLGDIANIGTIHWDSDVDPSAVLAVQTRVGRDRTVLRYMRINDIGDEEELLGPVTGDKELDDLYKLALKDKTGRYDKLKAKVEEATDDDNRLAWLTLKPEQQGRGGVDDEENWSLWSAPYGAPGESFVVDGPRRFVQFRALLTNLRPAARARLGQISIEYSQPVLARYMLAWIAPNRNVDLGHTVTFTYEISSSIDQARADAGFDVLEIRTPVQATVLGVKLAGRDLRAGTDFAVDAEATRLKMRLLGPGNRVVVSTDKLEIVFDCAVLAYGTVFSGVSSASWMPSDVPQKLEEERLGDLTVRGSEESLGLIVGEFTASPATFTPNGDGINDRTRISFKVFQVVGSAPISLAICDLAGRVVRRTFPALPTQIENGEFSVEWDGASDEGLLVKAGVYLATIEVKGDRKTFSRARTIGVAY